MLRKILATVRAHADCGNLLAIRPAVGIHTLHSHEHGFAQARAAPRRPVRRAHNRTVRHKCLDRAFRKALLYGWTTTIDRQSPGAMAKLPPNSSISYYEDASFVVGLSPNL